MLILPVGQVPICHSHIPLVTLSQESLDCNNRVLFAIVNQHTPLLLGRCGPSVLVTRESQTRRVLQSMVTAQGPDAQGFDINPQASNTRLVSPNNRNTGIVGPIFGWLKR